MRYLISVVLAASAACLAACPDIRTFVDPQNPNHVGVLMDVPDMDALKAALQGKEGADAMVFDGVVPKSLVVLVES